MLHYRVRVSFLLVGMLITEVSGRADVVPKLPIEDYMRLQGTWVGVHGERNGEASPRSKEELEATLFFRFEGSEATIFGTGKKYVGRFAIDPNKNPREMDITVLVDGELETTRLIYSFEGDQIRLCYGGVTDNRPTHFSSHDNDRLLLVLKRK